MRSHLSHPLVVLAYVVVSLVWGSTYLAIRIGVQHVPPGLFGGIRFLAAGALLLAVALDLGKRLPQQRRDWITSAVVGILLLAGGVGIVIWAEQYVESGTAAVIVVTGALWMAVFDALIPRSEARPTWRQFVALLVGFAGTVVLMTGNGAPLGGVGLWGPAALLGASASWALGSIYSKRHPVETDLYVNAALQMVFGGGVLALIGFAAGETGELRFSLAGVGAIVYLLVFGSIVGYTSFVYLLRHAPAAFVGTHYYTNTIVAVLLGWLILDEQVTVRTFVAMATVLGSIVWVRRETEKAMGGVGQSLPIRAGRLTAAADNPNPPTIPFNQRRYVLPRPGDLTDLACRVGDVNTRPINDTSIKKGKER